MKLAKKILAVFWYWRTYVMLVRLRLNSNVELEGKLILAGVPIVNICEEGSLRIGSNVTLTSQNDHYHVNIFAPCKILIDRPGAKIEIGKNSRIHAACLHATKSIVIGEGCLIAANVQIIDSNGHSRSFPDVDNRRNTIDEGREIRIEDNVWIGTGSIVLPGTHIESGAIIGALSVVKGRVRRNTIVAGNPAVDLGSNRQTSNE